MGRLPRSQKLSPPVRRPRRRDPPTARDTDSRSSPRNRRSTTSRLRPAENRPPRPCPAAYAGRHRFLNVLPHLDTPPARTLSQSSVPENPRAQETGLPVDNCKRPALVCFLACALNDGDHCVCPVVAINCSNLSRNAGS